MNIHILGLDLSLTSTGASMAPVGWGGNWDNIITLSPNPGYHKPRSKQGKAELYQIGEEAWMQHRVISIVSAIDVFVARRIDVRGRLLCYCESVHIGRDPAMALKLGKLRGAVENMLFTRYGCFTRDVSPGSHRKLLYGSGRGRSQVYGPQVCVKAATKCALMASGAPSYWSEDTCDSASVLNFGMSLNDGMFFGVPS